MNSNILDSMGIGDWDMGAVLIVFAGIFFVLIVTIAVLIIGFSKLKKRYERFCGGRDSKSLVKEIGDVFKENQSLRDLTERNRKDIRVIYRKMESMIQKVGLVKYDAFPQMGGKLSFSLALLDEKNNGFIINTIHGGEGSYCYSKEIKGGLCEVTLGNEEEKALNIAMKENP